MSLDPGKLKNDILSLLESQRTQNDDDGGESFAEGLANIIDAYVKSQTITVNGVATTGSAAAQTQSVAVEAVIS